VNLRTFAARLLGVSAYQKPLDVNAPTLDTPAVKKRRKAQGGQLSPLPQTKTRWYQADLERAIIEAENGFLQRAAILWDACKRDGTFRGVLSTSTGGLVALPKKFQGRADIVRALKTTSKSVRSVFDEMCPSAELAKMAADGRGLGVSVGELLHVPGRDYPVLCRLDPQWLVYRWTEDRWYYQSIVGLIPITPGDGRWVLHVPGGRLAPWKDGIWQAIARAYISKEHSMMYDINWQSKLANPARVAVSPQGSTEEQSASWFRAVLAWGVNTVFGMKPGYDVKLIESNGVGYESFEANIVRCDREMIVATAGQTVTTDGGTGFANADIHKSIRADIIKETADALAYTVNTQILPQWVVRRFGIEALDDSAIVSWSTKPPKELKATADAKLSAAQGLAAWTEALKPYGKKVDVAAYCLEFDVTLEGDEDGDGIPDELIDEGADDTEAANDNDESLDEDVDFEEEAA